MRYKAVAQAIVIFSIPILLLASPLYVLITPGYVARAYGREGFPPSDRFDQQERQRLSDTIVGYLRGSVTLEEMAAMRTDAGQVALRPSEVQHLVDVKQVTDAFYVAHIAAVVLGVVSAVPLWRRAPKSLTRALRGGLAVTAGLLLVVAVAAIADFDLFFTYFHRIFFEEGTWVFYYEDTLIQLYPIEFWMRSVLDISLLIAAGGVLIYSLSYLPRAVKTQ